MIDEPEESPGAKTTLKYLDAKIVEVINALPEGYEISDAILIRLFCRHLIYVLTAQSPLSLTTKVNMIMNRVKLAIATIGPIFIVYEDKPESAAEPPVSKHKA